MVGCHRKLIRVQVTPAAQAFLSSLVQKGSCMEVVLMAAPEGWCPRGLGWLGPRASLLLGFFRSAGLHWACRTRAACVGPDQGQLQERRGIRSFCFALAPLYKLPSGVGNVTGFLRKA